MTAPAPANVAAALLDGMAARADQPARLVHDGTGWSPSTHGALRDTILRAAAGLSSLGVGPGDRVGLVADCGPWWIVGDLAILAAGGADVPRGSDTTPAELARILEHSGAKGVLTVGEAATRRVLEAPGARARLSFVVRLDAPRDGVPDGVLSGEELLDRDPADPASLPARGPEDPASVIYTSGTTGHPKGVTLLHRNFLHQLRVLPGSFDFRGDDLFLVMLPPWHCFERVVEYVALHVGGALAYSHPRLLKEHLGSAKPTWMASVPRVWEMVLALSGNARLAQKDPERAARVLRAALGGRLRCAVAGGGSVPDAVDRSYNEAGIRFLVGYGLTETSPVLTVRLPEANRLGTIGRPVAETEIAVVDRTTGAPLPAGREGVIRARGPQVMKGYWRDSEMTARVLDARGWFDTGDVGLLTPEGDLVFRGRAKDTIVLRGGEKVEPQPLEDRLMGSPFVEQAVIVGSDRKVLGALIVPRREAAEAEVRRRDSLGPEAPVDPARIEELLKSECARLLTEEAGFMAHERVARIAVIPEPFTEQNGLLTGTMKIRRPAVLERYAGEIDGMHGE
jgi:long-chain acyl-CoA synthetase